MAKVTSSGFGMNTGMSGTEWLIRRGITSFATDFAMRQESPLREFRTHLVLSCGMKKETPGADLSISVAPFAHSGGAAALL